MRLSRLLRFPSPRAPRLSALSSAAFHIPRPSRMNPCANRVDTTGFICASECSCPVPLNSCCESHPCLPSNNNIPPQLWTSSATVVSPLRRKRTRPASTPWLPPLKKAFYHFEKHISPTRSHTERSIVDHCSWLQEQGSGWRLESRYARPWHSRPVGTPLSWTVRRVVWWIMKA